MIVKCHNCEGSIGNLEKRFDYLGHIVCATCATTLKGRPKATPAARPAVSPTVQKPAAGKAMAAQPKPVTPKINYNPAPRTFEATVDNSLVCSRCGCNCDAQSSTYRGKTILCARCSAVGSTTRKRYQETTSGPAVPPWVMQVLPKVGVAAVLLCGVAYGVSYVRSNWDALTVTKVTEDPRVKLGIAAAPKPEKAPIQPTETLETIMADADRLQATGESVAARAKYRHAEELFVAWDLNRPEDLARVRAAIAVLNATIGDVPAPGEATATGVAPAAPPKHPKPEVDADGFVVMPKSVPPAEPAAPAPAPTEAVAVAMAPSPEAAPVAPEAAPAAPEPAPVMPAPAVAADAAPPANEAAAGSALATPSINSVTGRPAFSNPLDEGWALIMESHHTEARPIFEKLIAANPNNADAQHGLGVCLLYIDGPKASTFAPIEKALPKLKNDPVFINNAAAVYVNALPMRSVKILKDYMSDSSHEVTEQLQNALGTSMARADDRSRQQTLFADATKLYFVNDAKLESGHSGQKRWGMNWVSADEATSKWAKIKTTTTTFQAATSRRDHAALDTKHAHDQYQDLVGGMRLKTQNDLYVSRTKWERAGKVEEEAVKQLEDASKDYYETEKPPFPEGIDIIQPTFASK